MYEHVYYAFQLCDFQMTFDMTFFTCKDDMRVSAFHHFHNCFSDIMKSAFQRMHSFEAD